MERDRLLSSAETCKATGATYRQLDYWCRIGLVSEAQDQERGSGIPRRFTSAEVARVRLTVDLLGVGLGLGAIRSALRGDLAALAAQLRSVADRLEHAAA